MRSNAAEFVPVGRGDWARVPAILESGVDVVLHAAWDLTTSTAQRPIEVFEANVMATMRLLEVCREVGVAKFVYLSTCAVYGEALDTAEDAPTRPVTINGITKLLNE